jgi:hypothetical protein
VNVYDDARSDIAGKLTAAGVDYVTLDPAGQAPCVLVGIPRKNPGSDGPGGWTIEIPVQIIVPPPGDVDAAGWLLDMLEPIQVTYPTAGFEPGTVTRNDAELPAITVTVVAQIPNPTC